mgnify:FL=1
MHSSGTSPEPSQPRQRRIEAANADIPASDAVVMIPDDPGVKPRGEGEPQPKRFRLF